MQTKPTFNTIDIFNNSFSTPRFMVRGNDGNWVPVTWQQYREKVMAVAGALRLFGMKRDDKIGIYSDNSMEWIYAGMGIMSTGSVLVPVYYGSTVEQVKYILQHSDTKILFAQNYDVIRGLLNSRELAAINYWVIFQGNDDEFSADPSVFTMTEFCRLGLSYLEDHSDRIGEFTKAKPDNWVAQLLYTSGTTGTPKGVPLTYGNLYTSTKDWLRINGPSIPENSVDVHWLPNSHIFGWGSIGLGNILGFTSYLTNPMGVLDLLPKLKPHLFMSVPLYYEKLYSAAIMSGGSKEQQLEKLQQLTGGRLSFLLSGGAGLKISIKEFFLEAGMFITEGYGLTECSPTLTMNEPGDYNFYTVGKPYPCVQLKLAEDGEILARGPVVFSGYYKDPAATKKAFTSDGWFKTGDIGAWIDDKYLQIIGRKKEILVTTGGKNISAPKIENLFSDDQLIEHVVLFGDGKPYITAMVTMRMEAADKITTDLRRDNGRNHNYRSNEHIRQYVKRKIDTVNTGLAKYETIRKFFIANDHLTSANGLLTASLKIRRDKIYEKFQTEFNSLYENN